MITATTRDRPNPAANRHNGLAYRSPSRDDEARAAGEPYRVCCDGQDGRDAHRRRRPGRSGDESRPDRAGARAPGSRARPDWGTGLSQRWDSLAFQLPDRSFDLPGLRYRGQHPDAFVSHRHVSTRISDYAALTRAPVRTEVAVRQLRRGRRVPTSDVVSAGQRPQCRHRHRTLSTPTRAAIRGRRHPGHRSRPQQSLPQPEPAAHRRRVGRWQRRVRRADRRGSNRSGRTVYLSVSRRRRVPRRRHGRDLRWWLLELGWLDRPIRTAPNSRASAILLVTGVAGGPDLDLRRCHRDRVTLLGRMPGAGEHQFIFAEDTAEVLVPTEDAPTDPQHRRRTRGHRPRHAVHRLHLRRRLGPGAIPASRVAEYLADAISGRAVPQPGRTQ